MVEKGPPNSFLAGKLGFFFFILLLFFPEEKESVGNMNSSASQECQMSWGNSRLSEIFIWLFHKENR